MTRPKLLDLFSGSGGCAMGYHRAGFDVVGVDIEPHPDYPFEFIQGDAMAILEDEDYLDRFHIIHASPPCPRYSVSTVMHDRSKHPDLVGPVRDLLRAWGGPYVIENVVGAPLVDPVLICGWAMGLKHLPRHRLFETNMPLMSPGCMCPFGDSVSVFGHSGEDRRKGVTRDSKGNRRGLLLEEARELMGVPWMRRREDVSDAIPPAYTEFLGEQIIDHLAYLDSLPL
jgi:DNA (cytosine-5)-methyltransferase 1